MILGSDTILSSIQRMMDQAQSGKPRISRLADRAASWFVLAVLVLASGVALYWGLSGSDQWIAITVSVLVVTCPCALSLATPTAITAATGVLTRMGMIPSSAVALDGLANIKQMVFDKTGTLTEGRPALVNTIYHGPIEAQSALQLAQALERHLQHPIAHAFQTHANDLNQSEASDIDHTIGAGLCGPIDQTRYCIGHAEFVRKQFPAVSPRLDSASTGNKTGTLIYLANEKEMLASFELEDKLRPEAKTTLAELQRRNITLSIYKW